MSSFLWIFASANHYVRAAKRWRIKSVMPKISLGMNVDIHHFFQCCSLLLFPLGPGATGESYDTVKWPGTLFGVTKHAHVLSHVQNPKLFEKGEGASSEHTKFWPWIAGCGDTFQGDL